MPAAFTHYWKAATLSYNTEGDPLDHTAGNQFVRSGITTGDRVFVVSLRQGEAVLIGGMTVSRPPVSYEEASELLGENLYEKDEHLIGDARTSSVKSYSRVIPLELLKRLRFESPTGAAALKFVTDTRLDKQTLRGVRRLTPESAAEIERLLGTIAHVLSEATLRLPSRREILINRLQRDQVVITRLKALYADTCQLCGETIELPGAGRYSEGHHVRPLGSEHNGSDTLDNLLCVCPNCHTRLDYGCVRVAPALIKFVEGHRIALDNLKYHNLKIYRRALRG